MKEEKTRSLV